MKRSKKKSKQNERTNKELKEIINNSISSIPDSKWFADSTIVEPITLTHRQASYIKSLIDNSDILTKKSIDWFDDEPELEPEPEYTLNSKYEYENEESKVTDNEVLELTPDTSIDNDIIIPNDYSYLVLSCYMCRETICFKYKDEFIPILTNYFDKTYNIGIAITGCISCIPNYKENKYGLLDNIIYLSPEFIKESKVMSAIKSSISKDQNKDEMDLIIEILHKNSGIAYIPANIAYSKLTKNDCVFTLDIDTMQILPYLKGGFI